MSSISEHAEEDHLGEDSKDEGMGHINITIAKIIAGCCIGVLIVVGLAIYIASNI